MLNVILLIYVVRIRTHLLRIYLLHILNLHTTHIEITVESSTTIRFSHAERVNNYYKIQELI